MNSLRGPKGTVYIKDTRETNNEASHDGGGAAPLACPERARRRRASRRGAGRQGDVEVELREGARADLPADAEAIDGVRRDGDGAGELADAGLDGEGRGGGRH